jgi:aminopeptidase N
VPLPRMVAPGESVTVELAWTSRIPRTFARTGVVGNYFFIAQWFPKVGVLEEAGWNTHQFHAGTEFYSDYGVYDVRMTVPRGWVVGATGVERGRQDTPKGTTVHRYVQEDVHDFVWTTSPDYVERTSVFEHPRLPRTELRLLLQPEHLAKAERHFAATSATLKHYGEWYGPYPYGHLTIVDPAWQSSAGGMEYPTLFTAGTNWLAPEGTGNPEGVTIHEAGHQFWYGLVGNNEFEHAWLDEGLNQFSTSRAYVASYPALYYSDRFFDGFIPWVFREAPLAREELDGLAGYRWAAESDVPATPSWRYYTGTGGAITYNKTALWLHTLERHIGWSRLQRGLSLFFARSRFRHPTPDDLFAALSEGAGRDLTWFIDQVYRSSNTFDYAVSQLTTTDSGPRGYVDAGRSRRFAKGDEATTKWRTEVVVQRLGEAIFPVEVLVRFEDGSQVREHWDGRDRWKLLVYERPSAAVSAEVDPDRVLLLDVNRTNNSRSLEPLTRKASRQWAGRWWIWLQDLVVTYGFFL